MSTREKAQTATRNIESQAHELAEEVKGHLEQVKETSTAQRKRMAATRS